MVATWVIMGKGEWAWPRDVIMPPPPMTRTRSSSRVHSNRQEWEASASAPGMGWLFGKTLELTRAAWSLQKLMIR